MSNESLNKVNVNICEHDELVEYLSRLLIRKNQMRKRALIFLLIFMASLQRKLGRRYQRYISARQQFEEKYDEPREIWQRIIDKSDIVSALVTDSQMNEIFPLHGLNNIARNDLNQFSREYIDMAIDFALNIDPTDQVKLLRLRSNEKELIIAQENGTVFSIIQSLALKENQTQLSTSSFE